MNICTAVDMSTVTPTPAFPEMRSRVSETSPLTVPRSSVRIFNPFARIFPLTLVAANAALQPYENYIQRGFWQEAYEHLNGVNPRIIGITGSFGKTSVKHILNHVLEVNAATLATPGSVNTSMGIARIVRERLTAQHRFFICEMGAYGPGSIRRLCKLARPNIGVLDGAVALLRKPFGIDELVSEIRKHLAIAPKPEAAQLAGGDLTVVGHGQEHGYGEEDRSHT